MSRQKSQKVKKKLRKIHTQHFSNTSSFSEGQEDTGDFFTEEISGQVFSRQIVCLDEKPDQPELNNQSANNLCSESGGNYSSHHVDEIDCHHTNTDDWSSVEIPRKAGETRQNTEQGFENWSHNASLLYDQSAEDSLINSWRGRELTLSPAKVAASLSSCGNGEISEESNYTYSYVSTYTEATGTGSTKANMSSPPIKMKVYPHLNSTVCRGKDCIGDIEFPRSISPICVKTAHFSPQTEFWKHACNISSSGRTLRQTSDDKIRRNTPRCSTVLFGCEQTCSLPQFSDILTTVCSRDTEGSHLSPLAECIQHKCVFRCDHSGSQKTTDEIKRCSHKSPTPLLGFEHVNRSPLCSNNLEMVHGRDRLKNRKILMHTSCRLPSTMLSRQQFPSRCEAKTKQRDMEENQESNVMRFVTSSPCGLAKTMSLSISPIEHMINDSVDVQTHKKIVASSDEISLQNFQEADFDGCFNIKRKNDASACHFVEHTRHRSTQTYIIRCRPEQDAHSSCRQQDSDREKSSWEKCIPEAVDMSIDSSHCVKGVQILSQQKVGSQCKLHLHSKNRCLQAKVGEDYNKPQEISINGNEDAHEKRSWIVNQHKCKHLATQNGKEHHMTHTSTCQPNGEQDILHEIRVPHDDCLVVSHESFCLHVNTSAQKRCHLHTATMQCCINKLCMASQATLL